MKIKKNRHRVFSPSKFADLLNSNRTSQVTRPCRCSKLFLLIMKRPILTTVFWGKMSPFQTQEHTQRLRHREAQGGEGTQDRLGGEQGGPCGMKATQLVQEVNSALDAF